MEEVYYSDEKDGKFLEKGFKNEGYLVVNEESLWPPTSTISTIEVPPPVSHESFLDVDVMNKMKVVDLIN